MSAHDWDTAVSSLASDELPPMLSPSPAPQSALLHLLRKGTACCVGVP